MVLDYKKAGVDVEAGDELVDWLVQTQPRQFPHSDKIVSGIGGFASLFKVPLQGMKSPCLVSGTDGVGTKLKLAFHFDNHSSIGQDLVAMCVNDILTVGATPLFFLDYYATGKLELEKAKQFLTGLRKACVEAEVALVGGETAEMPGFYAKGEYDCAGFAVGIVDQEKALGRHRVLPGDRVIGISSSGFHSNGYSLLRKVFEKDIESWRDILLTPTALYTKFVRSLMKEVDVHAFAHITGGGMENLPRVLPESMGLVLKKWQWPDPFKEVQKRTGQTSEQMLKTLNCGIGWVVIAPATEQDRIEKAAMVFGFKAYDLGCVEKGISEIDYAEWRTS